MITPYDTLIPYKQVDSEPIQYGVCRDYGHISRYRGLRQVVHNTKPADQFVSLESPNSFETHLSKCYVHEVTLAEENRLDLIAHKHLGSASYSWLIAYMNNIEDGYTVREGQKLYIPKSITDVMQNGEMLAPVPPMQLNLGYE